MNLLNSRLQLTRWPFFLIISFIFCVALLSFSQHSTTLTIYRGHESFPHSDDYVQPSSSLNSNATPTSALDPAATKNPPKSRYAVALFLGTEFDSVLDEEDDDRHWYYVGARTLVYQLLHAERTKFSSPVPVVVMVTKGVRESKRQRLRNDGAIVVEVEDVDHSVEIVVPRYAEVFNKLRVFDPSIMPFEKVALLDTDMVITRPLDAIFEDPSSQHFLVDHNATSPLAPGLPRIPNSYVLASTPDIAYRPYGFPPNLAAEKNRDYFNAGVILLSPSRDIFKHYLGVLNRTELFDGVFPEQNLLNYVHRRDGPMPWKSLDLLWHLPGPTEADFEAGMAILHCKFWKPAPDPCQQSAVSRRWEMQGYWSGREEIPKDLRV
ncbi:hypothetical protein N7474_010822 [Penicillium riverlandense]|uniref:uncharacterized protein n=1 Tax=Penicillium riverlandense TaxID=1903569 RepID=UPI002546AD15|nr:uncharacterized protein N7474_010822 [Penicillium riverlandense]KAJ5804935.1 hypothetical protein N7474_010822 [Penicillium riverlandense]